MVNMVEISVSYIFVSDMLLAFRIGTLNIRKCVRIILKTVMTSAGQRNEIGVTSTEFMFNRL